MIQLKYIAYLISILFCLGFHSSIYASNNAPVHHFNIQMENNAKKTVNLSFKPDTGKVHLSPTLEEGTQLSANHTSERYKVYFDKLSTEDTFKIVFTGTQDCAFTIGYFAPGSPKIDIRGHGCAGGGYRIVDNGETLLLFVSEIHRSA